MKIKTVIVTVCLVLSASFLFAKEKQEIKYEGETWLKADLEELYHNPKKFIHERVYFEIDNVSSSKNYYYRLTPGKRYLAFYVRTEQRDRVDIWVKKNKKDVLKVLYDFSDKEDMARVFAQIKRKADTDWRYEGYEYFVVVSHIVRVKEMDS